MILQVFTYTLITLIFLMTYSIAKAAVKSKNNKNIYVYDMIFIHDNAYSGKMHNLFITHSLHVIISFIIIIIMDDS